MTAPKISNTLNKINKHILIPTLNIIDLNSSIKKHRLTKWIKKQNSFIYWLQETHLSFKDRHHLWVRGWAKIVQPDGTRKQAGVTIPVCDKTDLKLNQIRSDKEGHFLLITGIGSQEDVTSLSTITELWCTQFYKRNILLKLKMQMNINPLRVGISISHFLH